MEISHHPSHRISNEVADDIEKPHPSSSSDGLDWMNAGPVWGTISKIQVFMDKCGRSSLLKNFHSDFKVIYRVASVKGHINT